MYIYPHITITVPVEQARSRSCNVCIWKSVYASLLLLVCLSVCKHEDVGVHTNVNWARFFPQVRVCVNLCGCQTCDSKTTSNNVCMYLWLYMIKCYLAFVSLRALFSNSKLFMPFVSCNHSCAQIVHTCKHAYMHSQLSFQKSLICSCHEDHNTVDYQRGLMVKYTVKNMVLDL